MWQWIQRLFGKRSGTGPVPGSPNSTSESATNYISARPTKTYAELTLSTPNKSKSTITPTAIVLHHTSGSYAGSVAWCVNPASQVSYHVIIARDGRRTVLAPDTARTWHAGRSNWQGRPDLNSWSLGLAWEGDTYITPLGEDAINSALEYLAPRLKRWNIGRDMVLDHRLVSPGRKNDIAPAEYNKFLEALWRSAN